MVPTKIHFNVIISPHINLELPSDIFPRNSPNDNFNEVLPLLAFYMPHPPHPNNEM
jgi:hypothetical protein